MRFALVLLASARIAAAEADLAHEREVPRTILALYDGSEDERLEYSRIHMRAELPLNHLGLVVRYHDVRAGLPSREQLEGVRGVLTWFQSSPIRDGPAYAAWVEDLVAAGRRLAVVGYSGMESESGDDATEQAIERFWRALGAAPEREWVSVTYDVTVVERDDAMVGFERKLTTVLPPYPIMRLLGGARSHLTVERAASPSTRSVLVATSPAGGFIAPGYALYEGGPRTVQWYVDPFAFFQRAYGTEDLPKPDTTTLSGRRIFYSHVDGDGWRNRTEIPEYRRRGAYAAEVVLEQIVESFPDLPVTVGPVVGDLDPDWFGTPETLRIARAIFAQPHVEVGTHTYSHPLDWSYFSPESARRSRAAAGAPPSFLERGARMLERVLGISPVWARAADRDWSSDEYDRPRSYEGKPFDLGLEIGGSVAFIERLCPEGKRVEIVQWSGDTTPFEEAIAAVRSLGLRNINGGDSRLDTEFPSYAWVAPLGRAVGAERQIYATNSNENTYTSLWTDRYFGFKHLTTTLDNTESPRRVKPFNVYYHMYSGEKLPSLIAVRENLLQARRRSLAPVTTSHYASIADGFYATRLIEIGPNRWRVEDRDGLNTLAFDGGEERAVDWERSSGVVGQTRHQGRLYVSLDPEVATPVVAVHPAEREGRVAGAPAHLVEARWIVSSLRRGDASFSFRARGFGRGEMTWRVSARGTHVVEATRDGRPVFRSRARPDAAGELTFTIDAPAIDGLDVTVRTVREGA